MSKGLPNRVGLPDRVDVARQVQARRLFEGVLPLAAMQRLRGSLASGEGEARYSAGFDKDALGVSYLALHVEAGLPLVCQRTLEPFVHEVVLDQRMGVVADESEEAALPPGYEPLLAPDGEVSIADVIEDELILALPVVPLRPGAPLVWKDPEDTAGEEVPPNPFAVLGTLKKH
jgi:uncharacterized protein